MEGVTVVDHPLVQHKLTLMRDKERSTKGFRQLLSEIGMLLCYEVTRDLPLEMIEIETPMATMMAPHIAGKKLVFAPILRAGNGLLDGMLDLVPSARVAHIGLYRDPKTLDGRRILLQGAAKTSPSGWSSSSTRCSRPAIPRVAAIDRAEGARRQGHPLRLPAGRAGGHRQGCAATIPTCRSGPPRSTTISTSTAISCRASATRATGCTARDSATGEVERLYLHLSRRES